MQRRHEVCSAFSTLCCNIHTSGSILLPRKSSGLRVVIALHNTARGPAIGGVRLWRYDSEETAIQDALRLSEAMTFKAAVADIPFGGGKAMILADGKEQEPDIRTARLRTFGRFVESLGGCDNAALYMAWTTYSMQGD